MKREKKFLLFASSLALMATLFVFSAHFAYGDVKVVGYYPDYLKTALPAKKIKFENFTQINHSFAWPNDRKNLNLFVKTFRAAFDNYSEVWLINMAVSPYSNNIFGIIFFNL